MLTSLRYHLKSNSRFILMVLIIPFLSGCSNFYKSGFQPKADAQSFLQQKPISGDAITNFISSIRPAKNNSPSRIRLAEHFQKLGRHDFAVDELQKVIKENPSNIRAYNALGISYDMLGYYDLARKSYTSSLQLNPDLDYIHNNIGYSHLLQGNFDEAAGSFETAVTMNPNCKKYHNNLGLAYTHLGKSQKAFLEFKTAGGEKNAIKNIKMIASSLAKPIKQKEFQDQIVIPNSLSDTVPATDNYSDPNIKQASKTYTVQIGICTNQEKATSLAIKASTKGIESPYIQTVEKEDPYYRVRFGNFSTKAEAEAAVSIIANRGIFNATACASVSTLREYPKLTASIKPGKKDKLTLAKSPLEISEGNWIYGMGTPKKDRDSTTSYSYYLHSKKFLEPSLSYEDIIQPILSCEIAMRQENIYHDDALLMCKR